MAGFGAPTIGQMNGRSLLWRGAFVLTLLAAIVQAWLLQRAYAEMDRLVARLVPQGELRFEGLWPFLWGEVRIWGLSFQPEGLLKISMQTPTGFRVSVRELRIARWRLDENRQIEFVKGSLRGLHVPLDPGAAAPAARAVRARLPTPAELGFSALEMELDFTARYLGAADMAVLDADGRSNVWGKVRASVQLEGNAAAFARSQDQLLLRKLRVDFPDHQQLLQLKQLAARRAALSNAAWAQGLGAGLQQRARTERWDWTAGSLDALQRAIKESRSVRITLQPPGSFPARNLRLVKPAQWSRELGFRLRAPAPPGVGDAGAGDDQRS